MRSFLLVLLVSAALPATALAAGPGAVAIIPPSNPGANQYLENVPTATGGSSGQAVFERATSGRPDTTRALPAKTQKALTSLGADGRQAAALAAATAPAALSGAGTTVTSSRAATGATGSSRAGAGAATRGRRGAGAAGSHTRAGSDASPAGTAPVASIARAAVGAGSGGIDVWLPVALVVTAAGVAAVALGRRRAG